MHSRVLAVLRGERPDRIPFISRMELWYSCHARAGTLPEEFKTSAAGQASSILSPFVVPVPAETPGMRLTEIHQMLGFGQQHQMIVHARKLRGVELIMRLNGEVFFHETDPVVDYFPRLFNMLKLDTPGETEVSFITPVGTLTTRSVLAPETIAAGAVPIMIEHPIKSFEDLPALEYIYDHAEFVPRFDEVHQIEQALGCIGFVAPFLDRIPFQKACLDLFGEIPFFYALHDNPAGIERLLALLDQVTREDIRGLAAFHYPYIQFDDNLDGMITNPRLYQKYCLPQYQAYTEMLHAQGKKVGSHTDGNLKRLAQWMPESGLDVFESFSPAPLTDCSFDEAWAAWEGQGPIIWGGIPSTLLEPQIADAELEAYLEHLLELVGSRQIILGVSDLIMANNDIERVRYIARRLSEFLLPEH
jgi:hypothetical protein